VSGAWIATGSSSDPELAPNAAAQATDPTDETLSALARDAARGVGAVRAAILLAARDGRPRLGDAWALSAHDRLSIERSVSRWGQAQRLALRRRRQIVVAAAADQVDPRGSVARGSEGLSLAATPLILGAAVMGVLEVHRADCDPWTRKDLRLLARHAKICASAVQARSAAERRRRQGAGFELIVHSLLRDTHEHANRLHAIGALISMGEDEEARRFIAGLMGGNQEPEEALLGGITEPMLAGMLLGEIAASRERGILLEVDPHSRLAQVPATLSVPQWSALVGSLLGYALEGMSDLPPLRRRAVFEARDHEGEAVLRIHDLDHSVGSELSSPAEACLREAVAAVGASVAIEPRHSGTVATVRVSPVCAPHSNGVQHKHRR
jgi:hypothetical protein